MRKLDLVFWTATSIFLHALVLFAITGEQLWLFLLVGSYLLRPTLASLGFKSRIDEMQLLVHYRSGNIAYGTTNTAALIFAAMYLSQGNPCWTSFVLITVIGLIARVLFVMIVSDGFRGNLLQNLKFSMNAALTYRRKNLDEWQLRVHYRSGNIAFATDLLVAILFTIYYSSIENHCFEALIGVICIGVATRATFNVILMKSYRLAASKMIMGVGFMVTLFSVLDVPLGWGTVVVASPGLLVAGIGWLSQRYPRSVGILVMAVFAAFMFIILINRQLNWGQILTAVLVGSPLLIATYLLFKPDRAPAVTTLDEA